MRLWLDTSAAAGRINAYAKRCIELLMRASLRPARLNRRLVGARNERVKNDARRGKFFPS
jgi:hypothetical protein